MARIYVQRVREESCTNGRVSIPPGNWHVTYEGFTGILPNIMTLKLLLKMIRIRVIASGFCTAEYGTESDNPSLSAAVEAGRSITTLAPIEGSNSLHLFEGGGLCPREGTLAGTGEVTEQGAVPPRIRLTLI